MSTPQDNPNDAGVRVTANADDPYRSDPRESEIRELKKQVASLTQQRDDNQRNVDYWQNKYYTHVESANKAQAELRAHAKRFPIVMAKFFLWFLFVPAWLGVGIALIAVPLLRYFRTNHASDELWFLLVGGGLLFFLWLFLKEQAER